MILKRSILLSPSFSCIHCLHNSQCSTTSSSSSVSTRHSSRRSHQRQRYATVAHDSTLSRKNHEIHDLDWPEVTPPHKTPTPYEIFGLQRNAHYSKHRFYELVKIYHPDRPSASPESVKNSPDAQSTISASTRLERYRLIVAAHDILSDPIKRRDYDRYGAGWNGNTEIHGPRFHRHDRSRRPGSAGGGAGGFRFGDDPADDPMNNATWEDWERWYARGSPREDAPSPPQTPVYVSNLAFVSLIVMLAALGGVGQATRAEGFGDTVLEMRDRRHDEASKELRRVREEAKVRPRDQRIDRFLEERDPGWHEREDAYRKVLPPPEVCSSEHIKEKGKQVYRARPPPRPKPSDEAVDGY